MKKLLLFVVIAGALLLLKPAQAADTLIFDSTDTYLGACQYTDTSTWTLDNDLQVTTFQLWYYWQSGETELPVTVTKDGQAFASFTATRASCDPYQTSWCNADYSLNQLMPAGTYTTKIASAYQCLKPGGTGAVRLYVAETTTNLNSSVAEVNTNSTAIANTNSQVENSNTKVLADTVDDQDDDDGSMTYVLIAIIVILAVIIVIMYVKCQKKSQIK